MSRGIIYIATGNAFIQESVTSAEQVKSVMPDEDITIFADQEPDSDIFDNYIEIKDPEYDFIDKIRALPDTPYDKTLYLDSDVYVNEEVPELFDILDEFEMAVALDAHQQPAINSDNHQAPDIYDGRYDPMPEFNTGVLAYRTTDSVQQCFRLWQEAYDREKHWAGQPSFMAGAYQSDIRICPLPRRYNYIVGLQNSVSGRIKVFHSRLAGGPEPGTKDIPFEELEPLIERANASNGARVTYPRNGVLEHHTDLDIRPAASIPVRIWQTIRERGIRSGIRVWIRKARQEYL